MRLYFVYRGRSTPSGGHKQLRLAVQLLNETGVEAFLLPDGPTQDDHLYQVDVPRAEFGLEEAEDRVGAKDILIAPEVGLHRFFRLTKDWRCRKAEPQVPWVEIDNVPEAEVARRFRQHAIFFATQDQEGCPMPALEAMTCNCVVTGYAGTQAFPHPYATPANGLWAPDRSVRQGA